MGKALNGPTHSGQAGLTSLVQTKDFGCPEKLKHMPHWLLAWAMH